MWKFNKKPSEQGTLPLTLRNLEGLIAVEKKRAVLRQGLYSTFLLLLASVVLATCLIVLMLHFYSAPILFAKSGWVTVRNLTPVVSVNARTAGALDQVFVSPGQIVQKGELLGAIETASVKLDYQETRRDFADQIVALHCYASLQLNRTIFELPYDAQILVDQMIGQSDNSYQVDRCEQELLRNLTAAQSMEESMAALEDQLRALESIIDLNASEKAAPAFDDKTLRIEEVDEEFFSGLDETRLGTTPQSDRKDYLPSVQRAQVKRELRLARKEYFQEQLQKENQLDSAIEQTIQELRYLDKKLREINKQLENNYIYASITGIVVGAGRSKTGSHYKKSETVFELQPIKNEFQVSVVVNEEETDRFHTGAHLNISIGNTEEGLPQLSATVNSVLRKPNGKLEAVLKLEGNTKRNADSILASGYKGEGSQRLPANITTGQDKVWKTINDIVFQGKTL